MNATSPAPRLATFPTAVKAPDCDADNVPDECQFDCNADGLPDVCEPDCNGNRLDDACDLANGPGADCNANLVLDECDILFGWPDGNGNGILDFCEGIPGPALAEPNAKPQKQVSFLCGEPQRRRQPDRPSRATDPVERVSGDQRAVPLRSSGGHGALSGLRNAGHGVSLRCAFLYAGVSGLGSRSLRAVLHVTGESVVPASVYNVAHLGSACMGQEATCVETSASLTIGTGGWGDVNEDTGGLNVLDVSAWWTR